MKLTISDHFSYSSLFLYTLSSIGMMLFTSVYVIIDGLFVSNFVGLEPFAALNLIFPFIQVLGGFGFMMGAGGSALVAKTFGEGDDALAKSIFSFLVAATVVIGVVLTFGGFLLMGPVACFLGATGTMYEDCLLYGRICILSLSFFMLQMAFQSFFACAGKPQVGLRIIIAAGVTNIVLDYFFIIVGGWGLAGAAWATVCGEVVGGFLPVVYFARKNESTLKFASFRFMGWALRKATSNGLSELMVQISIAVVAMVYNYQLIRLIGPNGVSAYGIITYVALIVMAVLMGFNMGSAPLISYNYGAQRESELQNLFRKCLVIIVGINIFTTVLSFWSAQPVAMLFCAGDNEFYQLIVHALRCYSLAYLIIGFNSFASNLFTALNNGLVSAVIACARAMVFETGAVLVIPLMFGAESIWFSVVVGEFVALIMSVLFIVCLRKVYRYYPSKEPL